jgi:two-component system, cell cycle response regulator DivK
VVPPRAGKRNVPRKRILLVDDYPDALEIWGLYLRSLGYHVDIADDGLAALEQAHKHRPDIIVLDLELPGITGFEAAVRLRQAPDTAAIPLIAATGYSHVKQLNQARDAGFDSIVIKPCEPAALVGEIERLLRKAQESRRDNQTAVVESVGHNR